MKDLDSDWILLPIGNSRRHHDGLHLLEETNRSGNMPTRSSNLPNRREPIYGDPNQTIPWWKTMVKPKL